MFLKNVAVYSFLFLNVFTRPLWGADGDEKKDTAELCARYYVNFSFGNAEPEFLKSVSGKNRPYTTYSVDDLSHLSLDRILPKRFNRINPLSLSSVFSLETGDYYFKVTRLSLDGSCIEVTDILGRRAYFRKHPGSKGGVDYVHVDKAKTNFDESPVNLSEPEKGLFTIPSDINAFALSQARKVVETSSTWSANDESKTKVTEGVAKAYLSMLHIAKENAPLTLELLNFWNLEIQKKQPHRC
jgi:hypothetical protein